jgi:hypothetical protein
MNKEAKSEYYQCYNTSVKLVRNVSVLANSISSLDTNSGRADLDSFINYKCRVIYNYSSRSSSFIITIIIIINILTPKKPGTLTHELNVISLFVLRKYVA